MSDTYSKNFSQLKNTLIKETEFKTIYTQK